MDKLRRTLPPLDPLIAFEAAARLESFTRAAEELSLSQAAVSQQIRKLEENLGSSLFIRARRRVRLTTKGRALQHSVSAALRQVAAVAEDIRAAPEGRQLSIAVDHSIAAMWLSRHLPEFRRTVPEIDLRIIATDNEAEAFAEDVDLAIVHGPGEWPGRDARLLFRECVFPVASPAYLSGAPAIGGPTDIVGHRLVHLEDNRWDWLDWRTWLSRAGVDAPLTGGGMRFNTYPMVIEAAIRGEGIALGWAGLVDEALESGALVRAPGPEIRTTLGYHIVTRQGRILQPMGEDFINWVISRFSER